jgi:formylglycine-generating enzyme required for sulfatase activity
VLYAITSGQPPFRAGNALAVLKRVAEETARPLRESVSTTPVWLCDLIAKLHEKAKSDRLQSATEVATLLAQGEAGATPRIPGAKLRPQGGPWRRWAGAGVIGLAALSILLYALNRPSADTSATSPEQRPSSSGANGAAEATASSYRNAFGMEFVLLPKGSFWMGGGNGAPSDTQVQIPYDFYLGKYELTQEEWQAVMGNNPSGFSRAGASKELVKDVSDADLKRFPVERVSWFDARQFMTRLNEKAPDTNWIYRLPREKEWEYACRGGSMTDRSESAFDYYFEKPTNELRADQANFMSDKALERTCRVGSYRPNRLGLYDMHGNVNEWCEDERPGMPMPHRGGCWEFEDSECSARPRVRSGAPPVDRHNSLGLRVARVPRVAKTE